MTGRFGDIATGGGYLGEIVELPGGMVGLALFNEHGWERRIVYVPAEGVEVIKLAQDRPRFEDARNDELGSLTAAHERERSREPPGQSW